MSIPPLLESEFFSCDDAIKELNVESVLHSNPFLSTEPVQDPLTYNPHVPTIRNFVDYCNSGTLAASLDHSNPVLMATFCNTSRPNDGQSQNTLPGAIPADNIKHKMIEKQRRKDMNALLSTLKSLIPDENLRGKRSVSDQMQEAVNYVNHLRQKVEDLQKEREKLKPNSDKNAEVSFQGVRLSCNEKFCLETPVIGGYAGEFPNVKIKSTDSAVQVWMNTFEYQIVYSDLLMSLEDCGLEVVCADSSTINNRVYHTIHAKVFDLNSFNIDTLYENLWNLIRTRPQTRPGFTVR
eukprot:PITA_14654